MSKNEANHTESRKEDWGTPQDMFDKLDSVFDFKVDLCASKDNTKTQLYISEEIDIMSLDAGFSVDAFIGARDYLWVNPPYKTRGGTGNYVARAVELAGSRGLVCLIPASVGSKWWLENVWANFEAFIFPRRFNFEGAEGSGAMFDCAICIKWAKVGAYAQTSHITQKLRQLRDLELGVIAERHSW